MWKKRKVICYRDSKSKISAKILIIDKSHINYSPI